MTDHNASGGRRASQTSSRRPSLLGVLTLLIPLLSVAALALVQPEPVPPTDFAPTITERTHSTSTCPGALPGAERIWLAHAENAAGEISLQTQGGDSQVNDRLLTMTDGPLMIREPRPVSVLVDGPGFAAEVSATRAGAGQVLSCGEPVPEQWFTGVGAGAERFSTLSLMNPDRGPAVADVVVLGADGVVDVPALRGVRVQGGRTMEFDMAQIAPSRDALGLQVVVTRGRLGVSVVDTVETLGRGPRLQEWLPAQAEPGLTTYLPGVGPRPAQRILTVSNPGDTQARVVLKLVTLTSEFTPTEAPELEVEPQSVAEVDVSELLGRAEAADVVAVRLDATSPVTAALRSVGPGDLVEATGGTLLEERAVAALPEGAKQLLVFAASAPGVITWTAIGADGATIQQQRVEIDPATGARVVLPPAARVLDLRLDRLDAVAAVQVSPPGFGVLGLTELDTTAEVPHVRWVPGDVVQSP